MSDDTTRYRHNSLWMDQIAEAGEIIRRPPLDGDARYDVVIVGAGFTGLWLAYYLRTRNPDLTVAIIEAETAGFGASGRNGGWCSGEFAMRPERFAPGEIARQYEAIWRSIDEIHRVTRVEAIDCHFHKGGSVHVATSEPQLERLHRDMAWFRSLGFGSEDRHWLEREEAVERVGSDRILGGVFTRHCAAIQPALLVRGLAQVVERLGVEIFEGTRATSIEPGIVETDRGSVYGRHVLDCIEAFTAQMRGRGRERIPVYSLMVATEPLSDEVWKRIGLSDRETFADARHNVIYGQRTADGRIAFGGRGAPYHFGSGMRPDYERDHKTHQAIAEVLRWLFPDTADVRITHTWGGAVAVPRDFTSAIRWDGDLGFGTAGGYVGAGVTTSNLAGRTLADLVLGQRTERTSLPWVGHRSRRWEPEPLRWVGVNLGRYAAQAADTREFESNRPSRIVGPVVDRLTGH